MKSKCIKLDTSLGISDLKFAESVGCALYDFFYKKSSLFFDNIFNEKDLQFQLATYLKSRALDSTIYLEYFIPSKYLFKTEKEKNADNYPWDSNLYIDIVVEKEGSYIPIELKFKTISPKSNICIERFGEKMEASDLIKNHGAQDLGLYGFWKDVKRLEVLKEKFYNSIICCFAIFITNDGYYLNEHNPNNNCYLFSMSNGVKSVNKEWKIKSSVCCKNNPDFKVLKKYEIQWNSLKLCDSDLYYTILKI